MPQEACPSTASLWSPHSSSSSTSLSPASCQHRHCLHTFTPPHTPFIGQICCRNSEYNYGLIILGISNNYTDEGHTYSQNGALSIISSPLGLCHEALRASSGYRHSRRLRIWWDGQSCTSQPPNKPLERPGTSTS